MTIGQHFSHSFQVSNTSQGKVFPKEYNAAVYMSSIQLYK